MAAFEKFIRLLGKYQLRRHNRFIFLINTTEQDSVLISYKQELTFRIFILPEKYPDSLVAET